MKQTALITGASSGIGKATAILLHEKGYNVYATARRLEMMEDLKAQGINVLYLDVSQEESMVSAVKTIEKEVSKVDILVNNAGYGSYGSLEEVPLQEGRYQFEVNLFGLARLCQLVIPNMRDSQSGAIINVSSVGGRSGEALGSWYHATKFAVEGLTESLWLELKPFGIKVAIVEPGPIITEWGSIAVDSLKRVSGSGPYKTMAERAIKYLTKINDPKLGTDPKVVAQDILKAITAQNRKLRYPSGNGAKLSMFLTKHIGEQTMHWINGTMIDTFMVK